MTIWRQSIDFTPVDTNNCASSVILPAYQRNSSWWALLLTGDNLSFNPAHFATPKVDKNHLAQQYVPQENDQTVCQTLFV